MKQEVIYRPMSKQELKEQLYACMTNIDNVKLDEVEASKIRLCVYSAVRVLEGRR